MKPIQAGFFFMVILAFGAVASRAEDLAAAEKQIIKNWQKVRSAKAIVKLGEGTEGRGNRGSLQGNGTLELLRKGDTLLVRQELKSTWEIAAGERKTVFEANVLTVCDGQYQWELRDQVGLKTATKSKPDALAGFDPQALFKRLRPDYELELLDEASVDGRDAFVIQATRSRGARHQRTIYFFSKDHGVLLKREQRTGSGDAASTLTYSDFEFDVQIDPKRFEFEPPEGVIVQDRTRD